MGTRNKTILKIKGKNVVNQYGQWDGYPTCATAVIVDFLKKNTKEDILKMVDRFEYVKKENKLIFNEITMTLNDEFGDIQNYIFKNFEHRPTTAQLVEKFGYEKASLYLMLTRDTGYNIFNVIKDLYELTSDKKIPIIIDEYDGWDIESKNIIDLDNNTLTTIWHDKTKVWKLDKLPSRTTLKRFENLE